MTLTLKIKRHKKSYSFKAEPDKPDSFRNNWWNNSQDDFILLIGEVETFRCKCQSVANYCFGKMATADTVVYGDSVAPGRFTIRCFVPPRKFHGEIHAITKSHDIDGQFIDRNAMQVTAGGYQTGRWLIHSKYSPMRLRDTNYAWSAGCIILSSADLERFNTHLKKLGIKAGDEIEGCLEEIE